MRVPYFALFMVGRMLFRPQMQHPSPRLRTVKGKSDAQIRREYKRQTRARVTMPAIFQRVVQRQQRYYTAIMRDMPRTLHQQGLKRRLP